MTALHDFISESNNIEMLRELLTGAENPNSQNRFGQTPLHIAVLKSERRPEETDELLQVVRELVYFGANINRVNSLKRTPLHLAVSCRNYNMIRMLLLSNAQINQQDFQGFSALHIATSRRMIYKNTYDPDFRVVKLLLKYHPYLDLQTRNGITALMLAVQNKNLPIVRELLRNKASVSLKDSNGNSAMHYAFDSRKVNVNIVYTLIRYGGSFKMTNNLGRTPLTLFFLTLRNAPISELEKAISVFKLFLLEGNDFKELEQSKMREISKKMKFPLLQSAMLCDEEIKRMREDKLAPDCSVFDIALRGVYYIVAEETHFPIEVFEKVIKKLISREYPFYLDVIAAGICKPYINKEFSDYGNIIEMDNKLLNFDVLYLISSYLSNFEMVNMMVACTDCRRRHWYLPRFEYNTRCNIL